jgi:opacity protein-like surface antigen
MDTSFVRESVPLSGLGAGEKMTDQKARFWLTAATLGALLPAGAVLAADLPVKARPLAPAYYDWSGVYVGVHAGYGGGMTDWFDAGTDFAARGFLGGGQVGINKQIASVVFGLELDGAWANIKGSQTLSSGGPVIAFQAVQTAASKIDGLVAFAGRAGLAADRWFVFAKGGLALAHESHSIDRTQSGFVGWQSSAGSGTEYRVGLMAGVGAEYVLGNDWSIKAEYNFVHLGARTVTLNGIQTNPVAPFSFDTLIEQNAIHVAKVGVNYRLGGLHVDPSFAPVPAAPGHNWSGAYVGVQSGYGFGHEAWSDFIDITPDSGRYDVRGWLAGGTVGVNAQAGTFVFGVEGEWMWTGISGSQTFTVDGGPGSSATFGLATKVNWLAIAAARAGFAVGDKLMIYGKAGVALADETHTLDEAINTGPVSIAEHISAKALHTGVVVGAGAEYALGGNWSAKFEYDYIRMLGQLYTGSGFQTINAPPIVGTIDLVAALNKMSQDMHVIKLGVNYQFNAVPLVVSAHY